MGVAGLGEEFEQVLDDLFGLGIGIGLEDVSDE